MNGNPYEPPKTVARLSVAGKHARTSGRAIVVALLQQVLILMFATLVLDRGVFLRAVSGALAASWLVSLAVLLLYHSHPTRIITAVVEYGFWIPVGLLFLWYFGGFGINA